MADMKRDVVYVVLASALPATGNFVAVALALRYLDAEWLGKSYALLAFFFVAIDLFNFGSPRIFTVEKVRSQVSTLIFLDCLSAVGSTVLFSIVGTLLARYGVFAHTQLGVPMVLAPMCYGLSHYSLGVLRFYGRSGTICAISTVSAVSRVLIVELLITKRSLDPFFPDLLLLVEAVYGAMLLVAYLQSTHRGPPRGSEFFLPQAEKFNFRTFGYKTFFANNHKEILGSWYGNAIFSGAKHVDIMIVTFILGPTAGSLYRGVKSVHNLAFNCGQGIALVLTGRFKRMMASLLHLPQLHVVVAGAVLVVALTSMASWLACRIHLFPTTMLGSHATQLAFMFVAFLGSTLIFFCRVLSLIVFSTDRTSFVRISTFEVSASLLLVSTLSYGFGLIGALTGVAIAGGLVLTLSLMCSRRAAQHSLQHCGRCSDSRCGSNRHQ
ncbi:hypothetical protein [Paraburkholderia caribensis]|uniref:hypothetical protein n=1 Tax=Paraburkholderia caribensis TaxID=75105 RepID=UPI001CACF6FD|nr:hypothetical protein [Paraburkholderia caribensis]CAG9272371.1 conserved membrane hypothetical protein [Paraburkholderia caribensis]